MALSVTRTMMKLGFRSVDLRAERSEPVCDLTAAIKLNFENPVVLLTVRCHVYEVQSPKSAAGTALRQLSLAYKVWCWNTNPRLALELHPRNGNKDPWSKNIFTGTCLRLC
eukprot:2274630-Amphidinium_carterae.1